ncbi:MAG: PAS domain S-box protein [Alphaproteobacteria bacterium]
MMQRDTPATTDARPDAGALRRGAIRALPWRALPWLALVVSLAITIALWHHQMRALRMRAEATFQQEVIETEQTVTEWIRDHENLLRAARGQLDAGRETGRAGWAAFVSAVDVRTRYPGVDGIGYVAAVSHHDRDAFEQAQRESRPGFAITPAGERTEYLVATYLEPNGFLTLPTVGLDLGTWPAPRAALEKARDGGEMTASAGMIRPADDGTGTRFAVLFSLPLYKEGVTPSTATDRRAALRGWVVGGLDIAEMMRSLPAAEAGLDMRLFDGEEARHDALLHEIGHETSSGTPPDDARFHATRRLAVGGRVWSMHLSSTARFESRFPAEGVHGLLAAGSILGGLLWLTARLLLGGQARSMALAEDVTAALKESRERYYDIIANTPEGYWQLDREARTVAVNDALCRMTGWTAAEMMGRRPGEFTDDEGRQVFAAQLAIRREQPQRRYEAVLIARNGERRHARFSATTLFDGEGAVVGSYALVSDISAETRAQQELLAAQQRLLDIVAAIPLALVVSRPDGRFVHINAQAGALFGITVDEAPGLVATEFYVDPSERRHFVEALWRDGSVTGFEVRLIRRDGPRWWGLLSAQLFTYEGEAAMLVSVEDVTARKTAEAGLRLEKERAEQYLAIAGTMIVALDRNAVVTLINDQGCRILGTSRDDLIGRDWIATVIPPENRDQVRRIHAEIISGRQVPVDQMTSNEIVTSSGERRLIAWHNTFVRGPDESITGSLSSGEDITDRRRAETELIRSHAELEQFSYAVSHDLQEPLRMVMSYLQLLGRTLGDRLDRDSAEYLDFAVEGARRMQTMIRDLLEYSRVQRTGSLFRPVDLEVACHHALDNLKVVAEESGARVDVGPLPTVTGDESQLSRLFQNLIGNAIKYRVQGVSPSIRIGARREDRFWVISVTDDGIGIDPQHFERIFQVFQRLHGREEYDGTGIGLAVCRKIVERHSGRIWPESSPGKGTTFHVALPVSERDETESP